ncbi:MAG: hypothetical protein ACM3SX_07605, partial [Deltaproteobacteria bacterium]
MLSPPTASRTAATMTNFHDRRSPTRLVTLAVAIAAASLLTAWLVASASAQTSAKDATGSPVVKVAATKLGPTLVDSRGRTLYLLTADKRAKGKSVCYAACAKAWPPLLTTGTAKAGPGAKAALLGVANRTDGT